MIVTLDGTTFITVEAFINRFTLASPGATFPYATGDLTYLKKFNADAMRLCKLVTQMTDEQKIIPTLRHRPDINLKSGARAFEYLATKRRERGQ